MPGYYVVSHHGTRPLGHCGRALPRLDWAVDTSPGVYVQLPSDSSATSGSDLSAMVPSEMPRALSSPVATGMVRYWVALCLPRPYYRLC